MTSKHTPGPWLHRGKSESVHTSCDTHPYGPYLFSFKEESAPTDEDLALILAAPDLLEALLIAVRQNQHDMLMTGEELRVCEAAIAKATGAT